MKVHPISHAIFETTRSVFNNILHHCSVSWKITPLHFCTPKPCVLWIKRAHRKEIFRLLNSLVKIHEISHVTFKTTSQFFFKHCITFQCRERRLFCKFLGETFYDLNKRNPSKCEISDFRLLIWNFTKYGKFNQNTWKSQKWDFDGIL